MPITKEYLDSFLDKKEQDKLEQFANDEIMFQAVKKVVLFSIHNAGVLLKGKVVDPMHNFALTLACIKGAKNEDIGADVRAAYQGINALELGMKDIEMYKSIPVEKLKENPAR